MCHVKRGSLRIGYYGSDGLGSGGGEGEIGEGMKLLRSRDT